MRGRLTIEDVETVYAGSAILDAGHGVSLLICSVTSLFPCPRAVRQRDLSENVRCGIGSRVDWVLVR
jgi:hypothetical protein